MIFQKKNKFFSYKTSLTKCSGIEKCLYENEKPWDQSCYYTHYTGPNFIPESISAKEIVSQNTYCLHPKVLVEKRGWRCYKCNYDVSDEKERHNCKAALKQASKELT